MTADIINKMWSIAGILLTPPTFLWIFKTTTIFDVSQEVLYLISVIWINAAIFCFLLVLKQIQCDNVNFNGRNIYINTLLDNTNITTSFTSIMGKAKSLKSKCTEIRNIVSYVWFGRPNHIEWKWNPLYLVILR